MNDLFVALHIEGWKVYVSLLLLPPLPLLLLALVGARLMYRRRALAWTLLLVGVLGTWATSTNALAQALILGLLSPPRVLSRSEIADLRKAPRTAILVLGAGRYLLAPEYGTSNLKPMGIERLRYGLWLARETGLPVAFSGGVGHGGPPGPSEAEIAARIAQHEFGVPLRWTEELSRDTNENAARSVALLRDQGIDRIVLVTHDFHMRRALAAFERAKRRAGVEMEIVAAPMGVIPYSSPDWADFLPSAYGLDRTRLALHEWIGRLAGA